MGGLQKWRDFLLALFPACFAARLAEGTAFDLCIFDLMQVLTSRVVSQRAAGDDDTRFDTERVTRRVEEAVAHYQNNAEDPSRPLIRTALVCLLDTIHQVPKNKSAKQRTRDSGGDGHMDAELYAHMAAQCAPPDGLFLQHNFQAYRYPLAGTTVWRSVNLKLQLYRLVTHHVLHSIVKPGKVLVLDDGVAFSAENYARVRRQMLTDHGWETRSAFEQEALLAQMMTHSPLFINRFMLWEGGHFRRFAATGAGEADVKCLTYVDRDIGAHHFLVVNQDSDVLFILLLHMRLFLRGDASDDAYEVWLDMRCPSDRQETRPYRYVNIKALYWAIVGMFAREYPDVVAPIETFCWLVFSLETDYTRRFSPLLAINERCLWDTFSALHFRPPVVDVWAFLEGPPAEEGYLSFGGKRVVAPPGPLRGILNTAVQYTPLGFRVDHDAVARFFFFLCQQALVRIRTELRLPTGAGDAVALEPTELLVHARDVGERLTAWRAHAARQPTLDSFLKKRPPPTEEEAPFKKRRVDEVGNAWVATKRAALELMATLSREAEEEHGIEQPPALHSSGEPPQRLTSEMETYVHQNATALARLAKKGDEACCGVPSEAEMRARTYRIEWYMALCRSGHCASVRGGPLDCTAHDADDASLSYWGWREAPLDATGEARASALNSAYNLTRYVPGPDPFTLHRVEETEAVSHRRYA